MGAEAAFHPALRLGPARLARPRTKPVLLREVQKPRVKHHVLRAMHEDGRLLVIHDHLVGNPAKPLEAPDHPLVGVLGVFAVGAPEVKPWRVPQRVRREVHFGVDASQGGPTRGPSRSAVAGRAGSRSGRPTGSGAAPASADCKPDQSTHPPRYPRPAAPARSPRRSRRPPAAARQSADGTDPSSSHAGPAAAPPRPAPRPDSRSWGGPPVARRCLTRRHRASRVHQSSGSPPFATLLSLRVG